MSAGWMRSWGKPWTWSRRTLIFTAAVTFLAGPFVTRWICLWQIPDVELPFDIEKVLPADPPAEEDALGIYRNAARLIYEDVDEETRQIWNSIFDQPYAPWKDQTIEQMPNRQECMAEFRRASDMERVSDPYPDDTSGMSDLRTLARFSQAVSIWLARSGNNAEAWLSLRATLRMATHADHPGRLIDGLVGYPIRDMALWGISNWAADPSVTAEQLRIARQELAGISSKRFPVSHTVKAEYQFLRNFLREYNPAEFFWPEPTITGPIESHIFALKRIGLWSIGQPDLALRLARQHMLNLVAHCDSPIHLRPPSLRNDDYLVFDLPPARQLANGQLNPAALSRAIDLMLMTTNDDATFFKLIKSYIQIRDRETATLATLSVLLAAHEFQRVNGKFPGTLEELVPDFLDQIPIDPLNREGAQLHYRNDDAGDATVWSVGVDNEDNGGHWSKEIDIVEPIRLRSPLDLPRTRPR